MRNLIKRLGDVEEGNDLENVESIKYLGVTITSDLRWNTHVSNVCTKANRTLGFLRRNLYSCPQEVKEAAYEGLVRPVLDSLISSAEDAEDCVAKFTSLVRARD